jgi:hypothetical protein
MFIVDFTIYFVYTTISIGFDKIFESWNKAPGPKTGA